VVVDDHPLLCDAVRMACEDDSGIEVVGSTGDGIRALELCGELEPDVLVLDLTLPGGIDGFEVARRLKARRSRVRILVLTASDDPGVLFECRRIGVDAFVEKSAHIADLPSTIRKVAVGDGGLSSTQERQTNEHLAELVRRSRESARVAQSLTERELQVLRLVASGMTTRQAAQRLNLSQRTIESHIAKVDRKLGARTRVQAVILAARLGLLEPTSARTGATRAVAAWREGGK
jgi:two-component system, NarL family, response regulator NreC